MLPESSENRLAVNRFSLVRPLVQGSGTNNQYSEQAYAHVALAAVSSHELHMEICTWRFAHGSPHSARGKNAFRSLLWNRLSCPPSPSWIALCSLFFSYDFYFTLDLQSNSWHQECSLTFRDVCLWPACGRRKERQVWKCICCPCCTITNLACCQEWWNLSLRMTPTVEPAALKLHWKLILYNLSSWMKV